MNKPVPPGIMNKMALGRENSLRELAWDQQYEPILNIQLFFQTLDRLPKYCQKNGEL